MKQLTWKIDKTITTACPDYVLDPYTGEYPSTHCLVYHCKTITENKSAEFSTEKEAKDFADKAPYSCYDFVLDGITLEDKRPPKKVDNITYDTSLTNMTDNGTITLTPPLCNKGGEECK